MRCLDLARLARPATWTRVAGARLRLAIAVLALSLSPIVAASVLHVDPVAGNDTSDGRSWATSLRTLARAVVVARQDAAVGQRATIKLAGGVHVAQAVSIDVPLTLLGGFDAASGLRDRTAFVTTLDAGTAPLGLALGRRAAGAVLDGFEMTGSTSAALSSDADAVARNVIVHDTGGYGVTWNAGTFAHGRVENTGDAGIVLGSLSCGPSTRLVDVRVAGAAGTGILILEGAAECIPARFPPAEMVLRDVVVTDSAGAGIAGRCCPEISNAVLTGNGTYGLDVYDPFNDPVPWPGPFRAEFVTSSANAQGGVRLRRSNLLELRHCVLWGNGGPSVALASGTVTTHAVLSTEALPGTLNISGRDPFLVGSPADLRLASLAAGEPNESPARDACDVPALASRMAGRTTRTDGAPDDGLADLGWHALPASCDLLKGSDPASLLLDVAGVGLPALDAGVAGNGSRTFYRISCDGELRVQRRAADVDLRWDWQLHDP